MTSTETRASGSRTAQSACPLDCPDSCTLDVAVDEGRVVSVSANPENALTGGFICSKVRDFPQHMYHPLRLRHPLIRVAGSRKGEPEFRRASWDEALDLVAERMRAARDRSGGESILPLAYGGSNGKLTDGTTDTSLFHRLGASNLLRAVCAAPTTAAAEGLYGRMVGVGFQDYVHAELVVVWGANPSASNIHLAPYLKRAQKAGAKLVVVDPRRIKTARGADLYLAPRPGTDLPLALSVIRWFFETGKADRDFLEAHSEGADELGRRAAEWTFERAAEVTGVDSGLLERFAELYADSAPAVIRCGWGLERNRNGGSAAAAVLALPAVAGKFGVRGGGYTMSNMRSFEFRDAVQDPAPPTRTINMNLLGRALLEERDPPVEVLFVYNANPLATLPEQTRVQRGLEREDLFTVVFDQVLTDTGRYADVCLPATTFLEHTELRNGYGAYVLTYAEPVVAPLDEARPNYAVFGELMRRLDLWRADDTEDPRVLAERTLPPRETPGTNGTNGANGAGDVFASGLVPPAFGVEPVQFVDVFPNTPDRKVHLVPPALDAEAPRGLYGFAPDPADDAHPLALISPATERTINSTFGQLHEREFPVSIHPDDATARGVGEGETVRIFNDLGEVVTSARIDPNVRPGVVVLSKGLWLRNTRNGFTANALAPDSLTDLGQGACFNDARVQVERVE